MNIFFLHTHGKTNALLYADKHVIKILLEIAQLCSNVYYVRTPSQNPVRVYRKTHVQHPMSIFVCRSESNFVLAISLGLQLAAEYTRRFRKQHKCKQVLKSMMSCPPDFTVGDAPEYKASTKFGRYGSVQVPLCMPEAYHHPDACVAYRRYYLFKLHTIPSLRRWYRKESQRLFWMVMMLWAKDAAATIACRSALA